MKRKGIFRRIVGRLIHPFHRERPHRPKATPPRPSVSRIPVDADSDYNYTLAGWRVAGGEWQDVEIGADLPREGEWKKIDLVTINLAPFTDDGFYRSANVFGGFDEYPRKPKYDFYDEDPAYTLDNLAYELGSEYGFVVQ